MKQTLLSFLLALLPIVASADAVEIDGIYYNLINKTKNAEVTSNPNGYSGDIVIPETVIKDNIEYKVTSIKSFTFYNEYNLGSITIPPSITHIGGGAFTCSTVSAVYISDLEAWINIKFDSIDEGEGFLETNPLANAHRLYLNGVEIKDLVIPNTIEKIGKLVFPNLDRLESITIPESVKEIGDYAFYGCRNLTSISIPKSLMSIGTGAFFNCSGLSSVHISDLESWCNIKFGDNPLNYAHHLVMNGTEIKDLVIPKSVTSIGLNSFMGCSGLTSIAIHNHVTSIGDGAFQGCTGLTSILIPNSVTTIGGSAFSGCI